MYLKIHPYPAGDVYHQVVCFMCLPQGRCGLGEGMAVSLYLQPSIRGQLGGQMIAVSQLLQLSLRGQLVGWPSYNSSLS